WVGPLAWSPDGRRLAVGSPALRIWDAAAGRELLALTGPDDIPGAVIFSPDATRLAIVEPLRRFVTVRDAATGRIRMTVKVPDEPIGAAAFSAGGARLVAVSRFGPARSGDATASDLPIELPLPPGVSFHTDFPRWTAVGADGTRIAAILVGEDGQTASLQVWDHTGKTL